MQHRPTHIIQLKPYSDETALIKTLKELAAKAPQAVKKIGLALPYPILCEATTALGQEGFVLGADYMHDPSQGTFTEVIATQLLKEAGAAFVLIGEYNERYLLGVSDQTLVHKLTAALIAELSPLLCIGESSQEYLEGKQSEVLLKQLESAFQGLPPQELAKLIVVRQSCWELLLDKQVEKEDSPTPASTLEAELAPYAPAALVSAVPPNVTLTAEMVKTPLFLQLGSDYSEKLKELISLS